MAKHVGIRPRARLDIVELASFIDQQSPAVAERFLDACEATFELLLSSLGVGGIYVSEDPRLAGIRVFHVQGFPNHLVFYIERATGIEIVRVLHGARELDAALQDS